MPSRPSDCIARCGAFDDDCDLIAVGALVEDLQVAANGGECLAAEDQLLYVAAECFGVGLADDSAGVEDRDFVGDGLDFVEQVRAVEDRAAFALQVRDQIAVELLAHDGVEAEGWVVEDHELGPMGEREHQAEADVLALGQMLDLGAQRQLEIADVFEGELVVPGRIERRDEAHDFFDAHPAPHRLVFGQIADAAAELERLARGIEAQHADRAVVALQQAEQHADRGRFAGGVAAEEGERLAALDAERHAAEDLGAAETICKRLAVRLLARS